MYKRTQLIALMTFCLFTCTQMQGMSYLRDLLYGTQSMDDNGQLSIALKRACRDNDYDRVKRLLADRNTMLNSCPRDPSNTELESEVLFFAKSIEMAKLLLQQPDIKKRSMIYGSIIHRAIGANYSPAFLKYYVDNAGIGINDAEGYDKWTPLHYWARYSLNDGSWPRSKYLSVAQEKLNILIAAGANTMLKDIQGNTALDVLRNTKKAYESFDDDDKKYVWDYLLFYDNLNGAFDRLIALLAPVMEVQLQAQAARNATIIKEQSSCAICLAEFEEAAMPTALPCAHVFHPACLQAWIAVKNECPTCRTEIVEQSNSNNNG